MTGAGLNAAAGRSDRSFVENLRNSCAAELYSYSGS